MVAIFAPFFAPHDPIEQFRGFAKLPPAFVAGGDARFPLGTDAVGRVIAQKLSERLKQQGVVENRAGASAQISAEFVAKAKPDGYTLLMSTNTSHSANPSLFKTLR